MLFPNELIQKVHEAYHAAENNYQETADYKEAVESGDFDYAATLLSQLIFLNIMMIVRHFGTINEGQVAHAATIAWEAATSMLQPITPETQTIQ